VNILHKVLQPCDAIASCVNAVPVDEKTHYKSKKILSTEILRIYTGTYWLAQLRTK
jgi:hypothetical protein